MLPQIEVTTFISQIFWFGISFVILYLIISKFIAPKIDHILTTRQQYIDDNVNSAHKISEEISYLKTEYEKGLAAIYLEAQNLRQKQLGALHIEYESRKQSLLEELNELKLSSLKQIEQDVNLFYNSNESQIINIARLIIGKIIDQEPDIKILTNCYKRNANTK